jgi:arylsulfatase
MHGYGLYPELTHVPLSIYGPGMDNGRTDDLVSLLDIHATVLDLAISGYSPRGRSLAMTDRQNRCLTEYHGFTAQKISKLQSVGVDEDLISKFDQTFRGVAQSDHYGFETFDGFRESNGESVTDGQAELQDLVADLNIRDSQKANEQEFSEEIISQLEDLGYA